MDTRNMVEENLVQLYFANAINFRVKANFDVYRVYKDAIDSG